MPNITWRADDGTQPAPSPQPHQLTMFFAPPPPTPFFLLGNPPASIYPTALAIPPPPPGMFFALSPPASAQVVSTLVVKEVDVQITTKTKQKKSSEPKQPELKKPEPKKEKKKKKKTKPNPRTPGTAYIFPKHHTSLNVIRNVKIWENGHDLNFCYKTYNVGTSKSVGELIEDLVDEGEGEGWAVTEVIEQGNGVFCKDVTVEYGGDLAKKDLASLGWNKERGACRPPVWLVLHKNE